MNGDYGEQFVTGMQGDGSSGFLKTSACLKHFAACRPMHIISSPLLWSSCLTVIIARLLAQNMRGVGSSIRHLCTVA